MIDITFFLDSRRKVVGFRIKGHDLEYICSAVSILSINTVNCIEKFTDDKFSCDYNKKGGFVSFKFLSVSDISHDARLLVDAFEFGCRDVFEKYPDHVKLLEVFI